MTSSTFSVFNAPISNLRPCAQVTMGKLAEIFRSDPKIRASHEKYKEAVRRGMTPQRAKAGILPWITGGGVFSHPDASGLRWPSFVTILDIDHAGAERVEELKARLFNDDVLFPDLVIKSPSGDGVKTFIS